MELKYIVVDKGWFIKATWGVFACSAPQFGLKMRCTDHFSNPNIAKIERKKSFFQEGPEES